MLYTEKSNITMKKLFKSLKNIIYKKGNVKISIVDIVKDAKVNRKTFYYHFDSVFDLLKWTLENDIIDNIKSANLLKDFEKTVSSAIDYIENNKYFVDYIIYNFSRSELRDLFYSDFFYSIDSIIKVYTQEYNLNIPDDFADFVCNFYSEAITGVIIHYCECEGSANKENIKHYLNLIFDKSLITILNDASMLKN